MASVSEAVRRRPGASRVGAAADEAGRIAAAVNRLQVRLARAGMPVFGSYDRAVYFMLVLRQTVNARSAAARSRPISMHAIAASIDRPYATVWRHIKALVRDGLLCIEERSVTVADDAPARPAVRRFLDAAGGAFGELLTALADIVTVPDAPPDGWPADLLLVGAVDLLLCIIDTGCAADWTDLLMLGYIESRQRADEMDEPEGLAHDGPNLREVARGMALPYSTVWRRAQTMIGAGMLSDGGRGFGIASDWRCGEHGVARAGVTVACAHKVLGRLAASVAS